MYVHGQISNERKTKLVSNLGTLVEYCTLYEDRRRLTSVDNAEGEIKICQNDSKKI